MRIRARENANKATSKKAEGKGTNVVHLPSPPKKRGLGKQDTSELYPSRIAFRINKVLYDTVQNAVAASQAANDFTYAYPADYIRAALQALKGGMKLTVLHGQGPKVDSTLRVSVELKQFYDSLPDRSRSKILERAIRTFMKEHGVA